MGCGSSNSAPSSDSPAKSEYSPKLLVIPAGSSPDNQTKQIHYYSLSGCQLEGSLDLPCEGGIVQSGFTIAPHPRLPFLYVTGCQQNGSDTEHKVWTINMKTGENKLLTSLSPELNPHTSVVVSSGDGKDFLYVFNSKAQGQRLDITTNNLEPVDNPISFQGDLESALCIQELLYFMVDEKLIRLNPRINTKDAWSTVLKSGVPKGHYTVLGDKIVVIDILNQAVSTCNSKTGSVESVGDVDSDVVKKSVSVIGIGKSYLYFTEPLGSGGTVSVIEYNLPKNRAATAGFIQGCPIKHKLLICWA